MGNMSDARKQRSVVKTAATSTRISLIQSGTNSGSGFKCRGGKLKYKRRSN
jgi:hypothetical protein